MWELKVGTEPEANRSALEGCADRLDRLGVEASSLAFGWTANYSQLGSRSLLLKRAICAFR